MHPQFDAPNPMAPAPARAAPAKPLRRWRRRPALLALLSIIGLGAGCTDRGSIDGAAIDLTGASYGKDFHLQDIAGLWRTLADYRGRIVLLFFGFTQCPDVCPAAMTQAAEVLRLLGDDGSRIQVLFVSLDPERDTPAILHAYIGNFHPRFVALRGDLELTRRTAEHYRVFFRKVPIGASYTIEHSAFTFVYDSAGRLRRALRPGMPAAAQAAAIKPLMRDSAAAPA